MASYPPPAYIVTVFNPTYWQTGAESLTVDEANKLYLSLNGGTEKGRVIFAQGLSSAAPVSVAAGTSLLPSLYFSTNATSGWYQIAANAIGITISASQIGQWTSAGLSVSQGLSLLGTGSSTTSSATLYSNPGSTALSGSSNYVWNYFNAPPTTGTSTGTCSTVFIGGPPVNAGGTSLSLNIDNGSSNFGGTCFFTDAYWFGPSRFADGTVLLPGATFSNDNTSGFYLIAAGEIGLTLAGVKVVDFGSAVTVFGGASYELALTGAGSFLRLSSTALSFTGSSGTVYSSGGIACVNQYLSGDFTYSGSSIGTQSSLISNTQTFASNYAAIASQAIYGSTFTSSGAHTITAGASLYIDGPPIQGGSMTITQPYSLLVNTGIIKQNDTTTSTTMSTGSIRSAGGIATTDNMSAAKFNINNLGSVTEYIEPNVNSITLTVTPVAMTALTTIGRETWLITDGNNVGLMEISIGLSPTNNVYELGVRELACISILTCSGTAVLANHWYRLTGNATWTPSIGGFSNLPTFTWTAATSALTVQSNASTIATFTIKRQVFAM